MRALVVQTAYLGDAVMTLPLLARMRAAGWRVTALVTRNGASLLADDPRVHDLLVLDKRWNRSGRASYLGVLTTLRRQSYDVAVAAQRSFRSGVLLRASGATLRVGFAGAPGSWAYGRRVDVTPTTHPIERYLALGAEAGLGRGPATSGELAPAVGTRPARTAERLLRGEGVALGRILLIAPGSERGSKRWPAEGYAAVADGGRERGLSPVLVGSPAEVRLCGEVAALARSPVPVLAGRIGVPELVALVARARALVANDSAPGHLAAAFGVPAVAIFGPTLPAAFAPYSERTVCVEASQPPLCRPCGRHAPPECPAGHFRCMREIAPTRVLEGLDRALGLTLSGRDRPRAPHVGSASTA